MILSDTWVDVESNWQRIKPEVCGKYLLIVETLDNAKIINIHSLNDGQLKSSRPVTQVPADLCTAL